MEARRLLIAEGNEDIRSALSAELQTFHYVRCCRTGVQALEILRSERPELLVLDMCLPELDGLTLLETIAAENIRPLVLAMTTFHSDYLTHAAHRLGVAHILLKPFSLDTLVRRVLDLNTYLHTLPASPTPEQKLETLLKPLGIHPQLHGYRFLEYAVLRFSQEGSDPVCKCIYRDTAEHFGVSYHAVETAIRRIIESCWQPETWQQHFPGHQHHPTAKVFLARMARLLQESAE